MCKSRIIDPFSTAKFRVLKKKLFITFSRQRTINFDELFLLEFVSKRGVVQTYRSVLAMVPSLKYFKLLN